MATAEVVVEVEAVVEKEEEEVVSNQIGVPICLHNVSQSEMKACREPGAFGSLLPRLIHTSMVVIPQHFFKGQGVLSTSSPLSSLSSRLKLKVRCSRVHRLSSFRFQLYKSPLTTHAK